MECSFQFQAAYTTWLFMVRERLEAMDDRDAGLDCLIQPSEFTQQLWRLRQECMLLERVVRAQRFPGLVSQVDATALLHDLRWLLGVSPSAPPALARQCVRIALDRVLDELQAMSVAPAPDYLSAAS